LLPSSFIQVIINKEKYNSESALEDSLIANILVELKDFLDTEEIVLLCDTYKGLYTLFLNALQVRNLPDVVL